MQVLLYRRISGNARYPHTCRYHVVSSATVDDDAPDEIGLHRYFAKKDRRTGCTYAVRYIWHADRQRATAITLHQDIMGTPPARKIWDHIDNDGLNNRRCNLRAATYSQNNANSTLQSNSTSRVKGVSPSPENGRWRASICCNRVQVELGEFPTRLAALYARNEAASLLFGAFAKCSPLPEGEDELSDAYRAQITNRVIRRIRERGLVPLAN